MAKWMMAGALLLVATVMFGFASSMPPLLFGDPDTHTRLAFIAHVMQNGGDLRDYLFPRLNAPEGMWIHWSLPFNLMLTLLAAPLVPFAGSWLAALDMVAPFSAPIAMLAMAWAVARLCRALGSPGSAPAAVALLTLAPVLLTYGMVGRVSHHVITAAVCTAALAEGIRLGRSSSPWQALLFAVLVALGAWQAMETVPALLAAWGMAVAGVSLRHRPGSSALWAAAFLPIMGSLALLVDPPPGSGTRESLGEGFSWFAAHRLSLLHGMLLAAMGAGLALAWLVPLRGTPWRRLVAGCSVASLPLVVWVLAVFPLRPAEVTDPVYEVYFWAFIGEIQPVWRSPGNMAIAFVPAVPALLSLGLVLLRRPQRWKAGASVWGVLILGLLLVETLLGAVFIRLATYAAALSAAVLGILMVRSLRDRIPASAVPALGLGVLVPALSAVLLLSSDPPPTRSDDRVGACEIGAETGARLDAAFPSGTILLSEIWSTPSLIRHTHLSGVAAPYYSNLDGIRDQGVAVRSLDDSEVLAIAARRGAAGVMLCLLPGYATSAIFPEGSLQRRLAGGSIPDWLEEVPLGREFLRAWRIRMAAPGSPHVLMDSITGNMDSFPSSRNPAE